MTRRSPTMCALDALRISENLREIQTFVAGPSALRSALHRTPEVEAIRQAFESGTLTELHFEKFIEELMTEIRMGEIHPADIALAALAVVLEPYPMEFATTYLENLASLRLAELPMGIRVAEQCRLNRPRFVQDHLKTRAIAAPVHRKLEITTLDEDEDREYDIEYDCGELLYAEA